MVLYCPQGIPGGGPGGLAELCPNANRIAAFFTEIIVDGNLVIPPQKPPKAHLLKVTHQASITDVEVLTVTLPNGVVAGNKIIVSGVLTLYIQYVAEGPEQKVHSVHYDLPFNAIVVGDCGELIDPANPIFPDNFVAHVCVEKIRITQINPRTLNKDIVLMVWIEAV